MPYLSKGEQDNDPRFHTRQNSAASPRVGHSAGMCGLETLSAWWSTVNDCVIIDDRTNTVRKMTMDRRIGILCTVRNMVV